MDLNWSCTLSAYLDPETVNRVPRVFYYLLSVLKAVAVAVVVAPIITWLYGWRVTRLMARRGDHVVPVVDRTILRQEIAGKKIYFAQETQVDLVVISAQHRRFADTTVLGVTTVRVTRHAPCPVLVVPRPSEA